MFASFFFQLVFKVSKQNQSTDFFSVLINGILHSVRFIVSVNIRYIIHLCGNEFHNIGAKCFQGKQWNTGTWESGVHACSHEIALHTTCSCFPSSFPKNLTVYPIYGVCRKFLLFACYIALNEGFFGYCQ